MLRSRPLSAPARRRAAALALLAALVPLAGCGGREARTPREERLTFEELDRRRDTTGLSRGAGILGAFEPYRMENRALRVRGRLAFPEGTVFQVAVYRPGERWPLTRVQDQVRGGRFDTPPIVPRGGPLPEGPYRFELTVFFESSLQPPSVMRATAEGRRLRGPGMTRDRNGIPAFSHVEEHRL